MEKIVQIDIRTYNAEHTKSGIIVQKYNLRANFLQLTIIIVFTKTATYVRSTCWATFCKIILYRYSYCKNMQHSFVFSGCVFMCELVRTKPQLHCCCTFQDIICVSFISWKYLLRFFLRFSDFIVCNLSLRDTLTIQKLYEIQNNARFILKCLIFSLCSHQHLLV